jgi:hypothetical protein
MGFKPPDFKSRELVRARYIARMGELRISYSILVEKPEGKRQLGRPGRGWEDNILMDLRKTGWEGVDWTHLA